MTPRAVQIPAATHGRHSESNCERASAPMPARQSRLIGMFPFWIDACKFQSSRLGLEPGSQRRSHRRTPRVANRHQSNECLTPESISTATIQVPRSKCHDFGVLDKVVPNSSCASAGIRRPDRNPSQSLLTKPSLGRPHGRVSAPCLPYLASRYGMISRNQAASTGSITSSGPYSFVAPVGGNAAR